MVFGSTNVSWELCVSFIFKNKLASYHSKHQYLRVLVKVSDSSILIHDLSLFFIGETYDEACV